MVYMNFLIDLISLIIAFVIYAFMSNKITKDLNNSEAASLGKLLFLQIAILKLLRLLRNSKSSMLIWVWTFASSLIAMWRIIYP